MYDIMITYDNSDWRVPDVTEQILIMNPHDTPLFSGLPKTVATDVNHKVQNRTLTTYQHNAIIEGSAFGTPVPNVPTQPFNYVQEFEKVYQVSDIDQAVKHYGTANKLEDQRMVKMAEIGTDVEHALLAASLVAGDGTSAARQMAGLLNYISTNLTDMGSTTGLTESLVEDILELAWNNGGRPDEFYMCMRLKRVISKFVGGITKYVDATQKRFISNVEIWESPMAQHKLFPHINMPATNGTASLLMIERKSNKVAILIPIGDKPRDKVAQTGHSEKGVLKGALTLEVQEEPHQALINGLQTVFAE